MTRAAVPEGTIRVAKNGYKYIKRDGEWITVARYAMERHLGRKLEDDERVNYKDPKDKENLDISNLYITKNKLNPKKRLAQLHARKESLEAEINQLEKEILKTYE